MASAASNATHGKQLDFVLLVMDGASGKLDPAFDAHTGPFKAWALTVWADWFPTNVLHDAANKAKAQIERAKGSVWTMVRGPVAAFIASAARIGWTVHSATTATDDLQQNWNFAADSPAAIGEAVAESVRRWRLKRIIAFLPSAAPSLNDCFSTKGDTQVLDFSRIIKAMSKGSGPGKKAVTDWDPLWASDLSSAIGGGQWPQVRKCKVIKLGISDASCQLCFEHPGTVAHRFLCSVSRPAKGYPSRPRPPT